MKNKMVDLRNHLFATLEALQDKDDPMDISRAKAIADVSQTLINSVKVEIDFINATDQVNADSKFFDVQTIESHHQKKLVGVA